MCGFLVATREAIRGYIREDVAGAGFARCLETMTRRGPDDQGVWSDEWVTLGQRRLSVMDLANGHQPMVSADGRHVLAYNGEIYNFQELREQLEACGHRFRTTCDTEVLLYALIEWGVDGLERLNGMFAFAWWDSLERELVVARDRVGIKPCFVVNGGRRLVVSSTMQPLWAMEGLDKSVDYEGVRDYLAQEYFGPGRTMLERVKILPPATWLRWRADGGGMDSGRYWDLPEPVAGGDVMGFEELVEATDAALKASMKRQIVADVPVGVLFSGGIDSSLVVHYMQEAGGADVKTYTVKFDQSEKHDEAPIARRVAEAMGTEHHELFASEISEEEFRGVMADLDQPFGDSSFLPVVQLAAMAREEITVGMGGDGGDEVFGGYPRYLKDCHHYPGGPGWTLIRKMVEAGLLPVSLYRNALRGDDHVVRAFSRMADYPVSTRGMRSLVTKTAAEQMRVGEVLEDWLSLAKRWTGKLDSDSVMRADLWYYLGCNGLVKTDRATMYSSLEARVPLLDNAVLDLVLPQPGWVRFGGENQENSKAGKQTSSEKGELKAVLKELSRRHLPREVWDCRKRGFTVPDHYYLTEKWRGYCADLAERAEELAPVLRGDVVRARYAKMCAGKKVDWPVWGVFSMLAWLDTHEVQW